MENKLNKAVRRYYIESFLLFFFILLRSCDFIIFCLFPYLEGNPLIINSFVAFVVYITPIILSVIFWRERERNVEICLSCIFAFLSILYIVVIINNLGVVYGSL